MAESTEMIALWNRREPKTDEEMVEEFMRFFDCFERYFASARAVVDHPFQDESLAPGGFFEIFFPVVPEVHKKVKSVKSKVKNNGYTLDSRVRGNDIVWLL